MVVDVKPAIATATPTPVEMNHVVVVVAVKHVGMATATMHHRPVLVDGLNDQLHIILMGIVFTIQVVHLVGIEEEGRHPLAQSARDSTAAGGTVVHVNAHTHMVNQLGHGLNLFQRRTGRDGIGHIGPIVGGLAKIGRQRAIFGMVFRCVGVAALSLHGMVPVLHQLGGSSSHAACIAMATRTAFTLGAEVVVWIILVPSSGAKELVFPTAMARHEATCFLKYRPVSGH